jgi:hypothetical protein
MPCCSCPLRACACAGVQSMTKNPGARCAPARSISRGCRPPVVTVLLPPSCPAPARLADARSPSYLGPSWCCPCAAARRCPETCARERSSSASPGSPTPAAPGRGPSRAHTAPVRARPYPRRESRRPRASGPAVAALAPACRACQHPSTLPSAPRSPGPARSVRAEVPSGLTSRTPAAAGTASRTGIAAVPRAPGGQPTRSGCPRRRHLRHRCVYQQVALSVTA